jgi:hypothetical protein
MRMGLAPGVAESEFGIREVQRESAFRYFRCSKIFVITL